MNKNKGFALMEVLIILAIVGMLFAVVLDSLSNSKEIANDCERYESYTLDKVPAKCLKYFGINFQIKSI